MRFLFSLIFFLAAASLSAQCTAAGDGTLTVTPPLPPMGGFYPAGTVVEMCFFLQTYAQPSANWLHSVIPEFGPGFDASTLVPTTTPPSCNAGTWAWYNNWTSCDLGIMYGPGFAFDSGAGLGCGGTPNDGNPGNNFGDGPNDCPHTWCWQITTQAVPPSCNAEAYLTNIFVWGDGESGSYGPEPCINELPLCWPEVSNLVANQLNSPCAPDLFQVEASFDSDSNCGLNIRWRNGAGVVVATGANATLGPGTYTVTVGADGCSVYEDMITLDYGSSVPTVNPFPSAQYCYNETITITANGGDGYLFFPPDGSGPLAGTSGINGNIFTTVADGNADGLWTITVFNGSCTVDLFVDIAVSPELFPVAMNNGPVCIGEPITFTGSGTNTANGGYYEWTLGGSTNTNNPFTFVTNSPGIQMATLTIYDGPTGCSESVTFSYEVYDLPIIDLTANPMNSCEGESVTLTATGGGTYNWSTGQTGSQITVNPLSTTTYTVTVTSPDGCEDQAAITIEVQPLLDAPNISCNTPNPGRMTFSWDEVPGADFYRVFLDENCTGNFVLLHNNYTNTSVEFTGLDPLTTNCIRIVPYSNNNVNCPGTEQEFSCQTPDCNPVSIFVNDGALGPFCYDPNSNDLISISAEVQAIDPGNFFWSSNDVSIFGSGNPAQFTPPGPGIFTLTATYVQPDGTCEFSEDFDVEIIEAAAATFTLSSTNVCADEQITVQLSDFDNPAATYNWDFSQVNVISGSGNRGPYLIGFPGPGTYTLRLNTLLGECTDEQTRTITVGTPIQAPIVFCQETTQNSVTFAWNDVPGATGYTVTVLTGQTGTQLGNTYTLTGLSLGETVEITVTAAGNAICPAATSVVQACQAQSCPDVSISINTPPDTFCANNQNTAVPLSLSVNNAVNPSDTIWSGSGVVGNTFDADLAGIGTHLITATVIDDNCPFTASVQFVVLPLPTATFDLAAAVCVDGSTTLTYTGSADPNTATFAWDFGGGTASPGTGPGPHLVTWPTATMATVSLVVTATNGCVSLPESAPIDVVAPLPAPIVNCINPGLDQVTFEWDVNPSAQGYEVVLISGTAGVQSGNTYTVTGLSEGDEVTIEVIALNSGICGNSAPTRLSCQARSCPPITVSIDQNPATFCADQTAAFVPLTASVSGSTEPGTFTWTGATTNDTFFVANGQVGNNRVIVFYVEQGCTYTDTISFSILPNPPAAISIDFASICLNESATVAYAGPALAATASYSWNFDGGVASPGTGAGPHSVVWSTPGNKTIQLQSTVDGCSSPLAEAIIEVVAPLPAVAISCGGGDIDSVSFAWPPIPGALGYVVSINSGTPQTITQTSIGIGGLVEGQVVSISVYPLGSAPCGDGPTATFECIAAVCPEITVNIDESINSFCLSDPSDFHPLGISFNSGDGSGSYTWSGTNLSNDTFLFGQAGLGSHAIYLSYTEGNCTYRDTAIFQVFDIPTADFSFDQASICITDQTTLTYSGSAATSATYNWDFGSATASPGTGPGPHQLSWTTAGTQSVSLTVTENGCSSPLVLQNILVIDTLAPLSLSCGIATLNSSMVNWTAITTAIAYEITVNGTVVDTITATSYTATGLLPDQSVDFTIRPLGSSPCGDGSPSQISCQSLACPTLLADFSANTASFCLDPSLNQPINLQASVSGGSGATAVFNWSGAGVIANTFDPALAGVGTHTIILTYEEEGPCSLIDSFEIVVYPLPATDFTLSSHLVCVDESFTLTLSTPAPIGSLVTWNVSGTILNGSGPHDFTPTTPGTLTVTVSVEANGCTQTAAAQFITVVAPLSAPLVSCGISTLETLTFNWAAVPGALGYIVQQEDGSRDTITALTYTLTGLSPSQTSSLIVIALGDAPCGDSPASMLSCSTLDCPTIAVNATAVQQLFCFGQDTNPVAIDLTSNGGDMSGSFTINHPAVSLLNGVYFFDPSLAGIGQHLISIDYVETAGCAGQGSITMNVIAVPVAAFSVASSLICENQTTLLTYTGAATATWDFGPANVLPLGTDSYEISYAAAGIYTIQLVVSAGSCSDTLAQSVEVVAPLATPVPACSASSLTTVTFTWPAVINATAYQLQIDNGAPFTISDTFYTVSGLVDAQSVSLSLLAIGNAPCGNSAVGTATCSTLSCPLYTLQANTARQTFCTAEPGEAVLLELAFLNTPPGNGFIRWLGTGVEAINGQYFFNPQGLAAGTYSLEAQYIESICTTTVHLEMLVTASPLVSLQLSETAICEGNQSLLSLNGDLIDVQLSFDFDGATVTDQGNQTYGLIWSTPGNYTIGLIADRNGCEQTLTAPLTVVAQPTAGQVIAPISLCAGSNAVLALSEQLLAADSGGIWRPGLGSPATVDASTGRLLTQNMAAGTYIYQYSIAGGVCATVSSEVTVIIQPAPTANAGEDQILTCAMGMVSLRGSGQSPDGTLTYNWTGPNGSFISDPTASIIDVSTPGTYILTVSSGLGCVATDEVVVRAETEVPIPQIELSNISCFASNGGVILVTGVNGGRPPYRYSLNDATPSNTSFFTNLVAGEYSLRVTDANGCFSDLFLDISQPEQLRVSLSVASNQTEFEEGDQVTVLAQISGGNVIDTLIWEPDSLGFRGEGNSITFLASETQQIRVTVVDEQGCRASDVTTILVRKDIPVYIPSGFSPNGDNINDILFIGADLSKILRIESFLVFNRWGEAVFQNYDFQPNEPVQGWDGNHRGEPLNPAVFVYVAVVEMLNGEKIVFKGDITLIR